MPAAIARWLKKQARELGFDAVGIAGADAAPDLPARLQAFLDAGCHGDMDWLAAHADRRADPRTLWPAVRSLVMLGMNYGPAEDPLALLERRDRGAISVYARGRDYHDVLKKRLKALARALVARHGGDVKVFVDTAPLMEKPFAALAGVGWQGKHTNLVSRTHGSWLFLGVLATSLDLRADAAHADRCGACRRCLDICPTDAFPAPYRLDARRCISYLTIEHKGHIPRQLRAAMGNRIYGCDDCLAVCPWNKFARRAREVAFHARARLASPRLADLVALDDAGFRRVFSGSPIKRTGRDRFVRNVLIAIGNSGDATLAPKVRARLGDRSPLVRAMAVWA
ncbi:MAG: tRNA epoxyqueuosine(34) reductase QueG, partial [Alphaproteobacteria bacterium]